VTVTAHYEGGKGKAEFTLYRCTGRPTPRHWARLMQWTASYTDAGDLGPQRVGIFDTPGFDEGATAALAAFVDAV
jgi:hypothetical protein